jgi:hypothetical protein
MPAGHAASSLVAAAAVGLGCDELAADDGFGVGAGGGLGAGELGVGDGLGGRELEVGAGVGAALGDGLGRTGATGVGFGGSALASVAQAVIRPNERNRERTPEAYHEARFRSGMRRGEQPAGFQTS